MTLRWPLPHRRLAPRPASRARRWAAPLLAAAALLAPLALHAAEVDARALLERMRGAAASGNYQGTMVFSANGAISSSRVWHYCVGEQTYERLEAQDGRQQRIYRHNDEVRTFWPQYRVAVIERREPLASWSTTPQPVDPSALDSYLLRPEGEARVAGREATVMLLEPRDALRFAQRLWADRATGLMLRADVIGPGNAVLETSAFSEVEIGIKPSPESVLQPMRRIDARPDQKPDARPEAKPEARAEARPEVRAEARAGDVRDGRDARESWRVLRPPQRRTHLEAEGWAMKSVVPGYKLAGCVMRGIDSVGEEISVLQAVFSDGLTHVSLFIEPFRPERHRQTVQAQLGATNTVTRRLGEHWITAVGDVPAATLRQFTEALERRR